MTPRELQERAPGPRMTVRVVVEHSPSFYEILGLKLLAECLPQLAVDGTTFCRVQSTPRWVLYRAAIQGHGDRSFHPDQQ
jgi:hypothetical protein